MAQGVGSEFEPQYPPKIKNIKKSNSSRMEAEFMPPFSGIS
jgi:hypothetical protein